jgi:hypothetical protein
MYAGAAPTEFGCLGGARPPSIGAMMVPLRDALRPVVTLAPGAGACTRTVARDRGAKA